MRLFFRGSGGRSYDKGAAARCRRPWWRGGELHGPDTGDRQRRLSAPAASLLHYFDPDGPFNGFRIAPQLKPGTAVLWVAPTRESEGPKRLSEMTIERLPVQVVRRRAEVAADHLNAPEAAKQPIMEWLKGL